jgi:hypothetical protein
MHTSTMRVCVLLICVTIVVGHGEYFPYMMNYTDANSSNYTKSLEMMDNTDPNSSNNNGSLVMMNYTDTDSAIYTKMSDMINNTDSNSSKNNGSSDMMNNTNTRSVGASGCVCSPRKYLDTGPNNNPKGVTIFICKPRRERIEQIMDFSVTTSGLLYCSIVFLVVSEPQVIPQRFKRNTHVKLEATDSGVSAEFMWDAVDTSPDAIRGSFEGYQVRTLYTSRYKRASHYYLAILESLKVTLQNRRVSALTISCVSVSSISEEQLTGHSCN